MITHFFCFLGGIISNREDRIETKKDRREMRSSGKKEKTKHIYFAPYSIFVFVQV